MKQIIILLLLCAHIFSKELIFSQEAYKLLKSANTSIKNKNYSQALKLLKSVKTEDKYQEAYIYNLLSNIYLSLENYKNAQIYLTKALSLGTLSSREKTEATYNLFQVYMINKNYKKAVVIFEKYALLTKTVKPKLYANIAIAYMELNNTKKALFYIKKALQKDMKNAHYMQILLSIYSASKNQTQLCSTMEAAYNMGILKSSYIKQLAYCLYKYGTPLRGSRVLQKSINDGLLKKSYSNKKLLFGFFLEAKEYDKALKVASNLKDDTSSLTIIQTLYDKGKYKKTINAIKTLEPKNRSLTTLIEAQSYFYLGEKKRAKELFKQCLNAKSTRNLARQWLEFLES